MSDKDILGDAHVLGLTGPEQHINHVREMIGVLQAQLDARPKSELALNSPQGTTWRHKTLLRIGEVNGALKAYKASGLISVEHASVLLTESLGVTARAMAAVSRGPAG